MTSDEILPGVIGRSEAVQSLAKKLEKIATADRPIFLNGPTGSGKELFARAIHELSGRKGPFVAVNCGAIPETLFESLLFGHERGAFTGADKAQDGFLAEAAGGTLFLDEIAELPLLQQTKLLRVLETGCYQRIGAQKEQKYTGRTLVATHADLRQRIEEKAFREDLFYRINTFEVSIPPLEARREDIPLLASAFAQSVPGITLSECALRYLQRASWPGNVRQLKSTVDRICILADDSYITASAIEAMQECQFDEKPLENVAKTAIALATGDKIRAMVDALVNEALATSKGNKTKAAEMLGVHRKVIERRCQRQSEVSPSLELS
ncbi:hypothetical protein NBRC116494_23920 [Aurantivibrio plasticivorans]